MFEFPLSLLLASAFVLVVVICGRKAVSSPFLKALSGRRLSAILLSAGAAALMAEGTFGMGWYRSWWFLSIVLVLMFCTGLVTVGEIRCRMPFAHIGSHLGLLLVLMGGFFGAPDVTDAVMMAGREEPVHYAFSRSGDIVPLPFEVRLEDFTVDYYEDGLSPRQYTSTLDIDGEIMTTSVNHPCRRSGFLIYQSDYDHECGAYTVLKVVRDPWIPIVFLGALMMLAAAFAGLKGIWRNRAFIPVAVVLAAVFGLISLARINFGTLMPALRSVWFVPHIIVYMLAYSVLALALVLGILSLCGWEKAGIMARKCLSTSSSLLLVGMTFGAIWAKMAWGDYWTWDGKECWAAATWLLTLAGTHIKAEKRRLLVAIVLLSFLSMQFIWYGVNYLPSSVKSLHTYNQI